MGSENSRVICDLELTKNVPLDRNKNYFETLPDELILKILQMAVSTANKVGRINNRNSKERRHKLYRAHLNQTNRRYIIDVLGDVSSRFRRITRDRTFWQGQINLDLLSWCKEDVMKNKERLQRIITNFISKSATDIAIRGDTPQMKMNYQLSSFVYTEKYASLISDKVTTDAIQAKRIFKAEVTQENIKTLSFECPNLTYLNFFSIKVSNWPMEQSPWQSLKELSLSFIESPNTFSGIQLYHIAPNLQTFKIKEDGCSPIMLPDMTQCQKLSIIELIGGGHQSFCLPFNYEDVALFPRCLESLTVILIDFIGDRRLDTMKVLSAIKNSSTGCKIQYEFFQDMTTICSGTL